MERVGPYHALTGRAPAPGASVIQVLQRVVDEPPTPPSRWRPEALRFNAGDLPALLGAARASRAQGDSEAEARFLRRFLTSLREGQHPERAAVEARLAVLQPH